MARPLALLPSCCVGNFCCVVLCSAVCVCPCRSFEVASYSLAKRCATSRWPLSCDVLAHTLSKLLFVAKRALTSLASRASTSSLSLPFVPSSTARAMTAVWTDFKPLPLPQGEPVSLPFTLTNGQSFSWTHDEESGWVGVLGSPATRCHVVSLKQEDASSVQWRVAVPPGAAPPSPSEVEAALYDYFQLPPPPTSSSLSAAPPASASSPLMQELVSAWGAADPRLAAIAASLPGMRILRQQPVECLFSFILSSNNNVPRIMQMVSKLRASFGERLACLPDGRQMHAFPTPAALAAAPEEALRGLGMGYRAPFLIVSAQALIEAGGESYLLGLRGQPRQAVQEALCAFRGVGRKVADCVALFSLDARDAIPVDTHVWAIATRYFDRSLVSAKSLTPSVYERVGDLFRGRYGAYAGWAHSLLFAAELPAFREALPAAVREEMQAVRAEEAAAKKAAAEAKKAAAAAGGGKGKVAAGEGAGEEEEEEGGEASAEGESGGAAAGVVAAAAVKKEKKEEGGSAGRKRNAAAAGEEAGDGSAAPPAKKKRSVMQKSEA